MFCTAHNSPRKRPAPANQPPRTPRPVRVAGMAGAVARKIHAVTPNQVFTDWAAI